jgi:hypothetical protein
VRLAYILAGLACSALLGCHDNSLEPHGPTVLDATRMDRIRNINYAVGDALGAIQQSSQVAADDKTLAPIPVVPPDARQLKMAKMIALLKGACTQTGQPLTGVQTGQWQVGGTNCPVTVLQHSELTLPTKWTAGLKLTSQSAFSTASGLDQFQVDGGLEKTQVVDGALAVIGGFTISPFNVAGIGSVHADITLVPVTAKGSALTLNLSSNDVSVTAMVRWDASRVSYIVNGTLMDEKSFNDLFSSFNLTEIMDHAKSMM